MVVKGLKELGKLEVSSVKTTFQYSELADTSQWLITNQTSEKNGQFFTLLSQGSCLALSFIPGISFIEELLMIRGSKVASEMMTKWKLDVTNLYITTEVLGITNNFFFHLRNSKMYEKEPYDETSSEANKFCQSLRPFSLYIVFPALYCVIN